MSFSCSVCGGGTDHSNSYEYEKGMVESERFCNTSDPPHWGFTFSYGAYHEWIGEEEWFWHYNESEENRIAREAEIKSFLEDFKLQLGY